jgi:hypothetical protein
MIKKFLIILAITINITSIIAVFANYKEIINQAEVRSTSTKDTVESNNTATVKDVLVDNISNLPRTGGEYAPYLVLLISIINYILILRLKD